MIYKVIFVILLATKSHPILPTACLIAWTENKNKVLEIYFSHIFTSKASIIRIKNTSEVQKNKNNLCGKIKF